MQALQVAAMALPPGERRVVGEQPGEPGVDLGALARECIEMTRRRHHLGDDAVVAVSAQYYVDAVSNASRFLSPPGCFRAGAMPRNISTSQKAMPANLPICQRRPRSTYS